MTVMKKFIATVSLMVGMLLIIGSLAYPALALNSGNVAVNANVNTSGLLTLAAPTVNFGAITPSDNLIEKLTAQTATVKTNSADWALTQYVSTDFAKDVNGQKLSLSWRPNGSTSYSAMSTNSSNPDSIGTGRQSSAGSAYSLDYGINVPWTLVPGSYTANLTYTLSFN